MLETLQQLDQQLLLFLNSFHTPYWDHFMWTFTGKITWIPMYAALGYVIYKNFRFPLAVWTLLAFALTIVYADQICATVIRPLAERLRPSNPNNPISEMVHLVHGKRGGRYGFPSCHAANSFGLAFLVLFIFRHRLLSFFILLWATVNSYSRVYIGVHYPGDLLAGMLVGLSGAILLYILYRYSLRNNRISALLHLSGEDLKRIRHQLPVRYLHPVILTGLLIILYITLSSFRY